MEILFDIFLILLALCGAALILYGLYEGLWVPAIIAAIMLLTFIFFINDSYSNIQWIEGMVVQVYKGHVEEQSEELTFSFRGEVGIKSETKEERKILREYEVAVLIEPSKELTIFTNDNDLFHWKFNKRAIQVHLKEGKKYKFRVYGFLGYKNIKKVIVIK